MPYSNISLYVCISPHTSYQTLSHQPNPGRSKYVFIDTQSNQTLSSPTNTVGISGYLSTHNAIKLYTLYIAMVVLISDYISKNKAIKLYPLYQTMVGLSMYLSTHKDIRL